MILSEFLQEIFIKGWKLWNENGRLRYRAPNNEATSAVLEQLQEYKIEILNLLEEQPNLLEVYPLSHGQQALWFLWQLAPESSAYNVAFSCRICSDLDVAALQKVFEVLIERHPILRSTFPRLGTEPIQQINLEQAVDFQQIDATNGSESELKEEVCAAYKFPFDLERGPIMRVRVFTRSQQEHILLLVIHHIAGEGWSIGILLDELKVLYPAFRTGHEATLPPPVHFHQHVRWQNTIIDSAEGDLMWDYWQQQLAGELPVLNLPTDRPRPSVQSYNGASYPLYLSETLTQQLKELAQSQSTTLYTILLAAFKVLLHRYTDQDDILVGSPTASRHRPEFTQIVGYLVNPVVLRANLSGNPSFREFLAQVRKTVIAAIAHQDYPFALIVKRLQPLRDSSRSIIFQASFVLQKLQQTPDVLKLYSTQIGTTIKWGGLVLEPYEIPQQEGQFDLNLEMMEGSSSVVGALKYNTDLFDGSTIERMAGHFQNLLSAMVENPQQKVSELPLLSAAERHQLLVEWNDTAREYPTNKCIHQLFESQVEKTPDAVAVVFENQQLTYAQLNQRANQLAHHLLSLGVGPEVLVGICVERSLEMVIGLLGILKAGGAYVPLDPTYPQERLSYILNDSQVSILLTQQLLAQELTLHQQYLVCLDNDWETIGQKDNNNPESGVTIENLAYGIYTSGSTGRPKGVMVSHTNVVSFFMGMDNTIGCDPPGSWLAVTSICFDISVLELLWTITRGFQVVVQTEHEATFASHSKVPDKKIDFSLFYFASDDRESSKDKYKLLLEGAKFADAHGFAAVWTPERHFHDFGGLYPNPSVTSAAIAVLTQRIQIRSGSVVLPLHNPIRVAEEWAVVDNLSQGRVGISFAPGWQANDFVFAPENYTDRKKVLLRQIETVHQLWRGESVTFLGGAGNQVPVKILPRPIQPELPTWLTTSGNPETFRVAGEMGTNVLTHLLEQSIEELAEKIRVYRDAWRSHGHEGTGHVTLI